LRRGLIDAGDTGGEGDLDGDLRCLRGVVKGEPFAKTSDGGGGRGGYEYIAFLGIVVG
jgi:hypothetical protein